MPRQANIQRKGMPCSLDTSNILVAASAETSIATEVNAV